MPFLNTALKRDNIRTQTTIPIKGSPLTKISWPVSFFQEVCGRQCSSIFTTDRTSARAAVCSGFSEQCHCILPTQLQMYTKKINSKIQQCFGKADKNGKPELFGILHLRFTNAYVRPSKNHEDHRFLKKFPKTHTHTEVYLHWIPRVKSRATNH